MTDNRYLPICKACRWYDLTRAQCFDGHLQYNGRLKCDGFECPLRMETDNENGSETVLNSSDDKT